MPKLITWLCLVLLYGMPALAQSDTSMPLPNRLVVSMIKYPQRQIMLDSSGLISIVCVIKRDSLVREQQRQLAGKLIGYTDSSLILHVETENSITYYRNGSMETFYYWKSEDSIKLHIDTVQFTDIHTLTFDRGKFRQVKGILQSTAYMYIVGNVLVLVTALVVPKQYGSLVTGKNMMVTTTVALGAGASSFVFYPREFRLNNQPRQRRKIHWRIESR